jgi:hypothetical protein
MYEHWQASGIWYVPKDTIVNVQLSNIDDDVDVLINVDNTTVVDENVRSAWNREVIVSGETDMHIVLNNSGGQTFKMTLDIVNAQTGQSFGHWNPNGWDPTPFPADWTGDFKFIARQPNS